MTISINIPEAAGVDEHFIKEALAAALYHTGKLSEKQAREMLGISRRDFEEMLPRYGYSVLVDSQKNLDIELNV